MMGLLIFVLVVLQVVDVLYEFVSVEYLDVLVLAFVQGICTMSSPELYSARRETINTGRNMNGIFINQ